MISEEKEFEENNEDDYEIVLPDDMDCSNIKLTPAIKQYSIWRVKEFLLSNGVEMRPYYRWYKAMRYRDHQNWVLVRMKDNTIIGDERGYTLYDLRVYLSNMGVPLHGDNYKPPSRTKDGRRIACVKFLETVNCLEQKKKGRNNEQP